MEPLVDFKKLFFILKTFVSPNATMLQSVFGSASYYCQFIRNFAESLADLYSATP